MAHDVNSTTHRWTGGKINKKCCYRYCRANEEYGGCQSQRHYNKHLKEITNYIYDGTINNKYMRTK